jgi:signal transduction histidine kinase
MPSLASIAVSPWVRDGWIPAAVAVVGVAEVADVYGGEPLWRRAASAGLLVLAALVLHRRRQTPVRVTVTAATLAAVVVLLQPALAEQPLFSPFLVLVAAFFALGLHASRRTFTTGAVAAGTVVGVMLAVQGVAGRPPVDMVPSVLFWVVALGAGRLLHLSQQEARHERERAERAAIEERSRIARELHDVIAHSLSVIVVQASVEARLLPDQDGSTARTLRSVEETGREALTELRRLLGVLRTVDGATKPLSPLPSLSALHADGGMLDDVRAVGHDVRLVVEGTPPGTSLAELSAYRVVQEALTNVVKHAPGAPVEVRVLHAPAALVVRVTNGPATRTGPGPELEGGGHGITGMRERARMYDGTLTAGAEPGGGWTVEARFPHARARTMTVQA